MLIINISFSFLMNKKGEKIQTKKGLLRSDPFSD